MNRTSTMLQPILDNRQLLAPIETEIVTRTTSVGPIQAVIFDIYGTLVVSGSGDVGVADESDKANRIAEAFEAVGLPKPEDVAEVAQQLRLTIQRSNESRKSDACPKPEVDIVDIWHQTLDSIGLTVDAKSTELVVRLAAEYESRANPTWDMPGATQLLGGLAERGLKLGIVSNAPDFHRSVTGKSSRRFLGRWRIRLESLRFQQSVPSSQAGAAAVRRALRWAWTVPNPAGASDLRWK